MRNETGMQNSIKMAKKHDAPASIIRDLENRKVVLSLYEKEDFDSCHSIQWETVILPALTYDGDSSYTKIFNLTHSKYYYAFGEQFPNHDIDTSKIVSYESFLK